MADREYLERLKRLAENNYFVGCPGDGTEFQFTAEVDWLIKQTERAHELEIENRALKAVATSNRRTGEWYLKENKRYREALEFYADSEKYHVGTSYDAENESCGFSNVGKAIVDHGETARKTLKESFDGNG